MRTIVLAVVFMVGMTGCAGNQGNPAIPVLPGVNSQSTASNTMDNGHYRLWGEWSLYFNTEHTSVEAVPKRGGRFHLNAVKFLESYCKDCLKITKIKNNNDNTIDLTIRIEHPFSGLPQYTGFDVKGIIMFNGSYQIPWGSEKIPPYDKDIWVSWKEVGDPELLNSDGYTPRWSPTWDSGSTMPIFNYWPGKYTKGTPTANLNAFLNFYTDEARHMFRVSQSKERIYHIWLPPGPVTAGYAVEACWEPPTKTPVDPAADFPESANQPEAYHFRYVVNGDQPITQAPCCGSLYDCETLWVENLYWYGKKPKRGFAKVHDVSNWHSFSGMEDCQSDLLPYNSEWQNPHMPVKWYSDNFPDGTYRGAACLYEWDQQDTHIAAYDVFTFTIDLK